jgi:hypothetical protein
VVLSKEWRGQRLHEETSGSGVVECGKRRLTSGEFEEIEKTVKNGMT